MRVSTLRGFVLVILDVVVWRLGYLIRLHAELRY